MISVLDMTLTETHTSFQNKSKSLVSRGALSVISEDGPKGQDPGSGDVSQCQQPQELSGATGVEPTESEEEPPHQMDDLSASLDDLNVTSLPEASAVRPNQDYNLVNSLLNLTRSPVSQLPTSSHMISIRI
jgi:hypothetical protein